MIKPRRASLLVPFFLLGSWSPLALVEPVATPNPTQEDTCPVCGMFVAKYPAWIATVQYQDGHSHQFDGAKDLFKYLLDLPKWAPGHRSEEIAVIGVTDYYTVTRIDARQAWYVLGSDVLGPMGHELIPLETREDADTFLADHAGQGIIRFEDVTPALLGELDAGRFVQGASCRPPCQEKQYQETGNQSANHAKNAN